MGCSSPSTRRAWIEMLKPASHALISSSPSTRRAWIEILSAATICAPPYRSPSTRRAWIEILDKYIGFEVIGVALHPEGVDRNRVQIKKSAVFCVALHPEGVDRNCISSIMMSASARSPSTRRAWIEMRQLPDTAMELSVALHPEGVDRNIVARLTQADEIGRPPPGGRG